ncbi:apolipoprotein B-100 [Chanos chanos]|uniref:Apolipoprotein B-100 n=1 Tax=Chanos chanos TaxID=29144 RepID=A0A6J2WPG5_CHACN|nr:apolipoprotein B-100 [Chanos chanos]
MGDTKLYLLLLLSASVLADTSIEVSGPEEDTSEQPSRCPLAARFKNFRKYMYQYTAESRNGVSGTANLINGPKVTCQVELEVPQTCSFVLKTTECSLSEVSVIDPQGQPVYRQAAGAEAFQAAMEKNPLNFFVEDVTTVSIFPEKDEPENILNVKRGIISALLVPVMEEHDNRKMSTIHGVCKTDVTVNSRKDIDIDVTVVRDLSQCSHFDPYKLPSSPLTLLPGLHRALSKTISSTQECNYQFDNRRKHMSAAQCTEKHIFLPFSHENNYGISSVVTQSLTLQDSVKINNRYFNIDHNLERSLFENRVKDKLPIQSKDDVLATFRDLNSLAQTGRGQHRGSLFQKLVSEVRGLNNDTLVAALPEMMAESSALTWQVLAQCGSKECDSAILQHLRTFDRSNPVVDAVVYAMSLRPEPCQCRVKNMLSMAQYKQSKVIMYALANVVENFDTFTDSKPVEEVAEFMEFLLGDCSGDEDRTFLALRVIGTMGRSMQMFSSLKSSVLTCIREPSAPASVQKAAVQALRRMDIDSEIGGALLKVFQDEEEPVQKRVAAYLILMREPNDHIPDVLKTNVQNRQVKSFVSSHVANVLNFDDSRGRGLRDFITQNGPGHIVSNPTSFLSSHNSRMEVPETVSMESNIIYDSDSYMPKEIMLETVLKAFDVDSQMMEIGLEAEGFEPTIEALFGKNGFFPDTISKTMFWASEKVPKVLENWIAPLRRERMKRQVPEDLLKEISENFNNLINSLRSQGSPEAMAYLRMLDIELGYIKTSDIKQMAENIAQYSEMLFKISPREVIGYLLSSADREMFAHYMFLDQAFTLPTSAGFPLKFSLSGVFTPGAKGGLHISPGMQKMSFMPSVGVEFVTQMGIYIPEYVVAGTEMHTNLFHESALDAKITMENNQIKLSIPVPQGNTQLLSISNKLLSVSTTQTKIVPSLVEDRRDSTDCSPLFTGMKYCTIVRYSNASATNNAPYYPLTGETRFALELQPTGEVREYTAAIAYELLKEGKEGRHSVDSLRLVLKAEGEEPTEASAIVKYNRNKNIFTTDVKIPDYDIEAGIKLAPSDSTEKGKKLRGITIDITNKKIPQLSLIGRARLESMKDGMLQFEMKFPALNMDATGTASLKSANNLIMELEMDLKLPETSSLQTVTLRYDEDKAEVELKSDIHSDMEKLKPVMESYRNRLQTALDDILDQKVAKTDMKLRHIVSKGFEAVNIWLDKFGANIPYVGDLRNKRNTPELSLPSIPEKLYLTYDGLFRYQFNKDKITVSVPMPLGGKSSEDLNFPSTLSIPKIEVPHIGLDIPAKELQVPSFTIPANLDVTLPLIGVAELTAKVSSNFCDWEGSISGGNITVEFPSYIAKYKIMSSCGLTPLSYNVEGTGMMSMDEETIRYLVNSSLSHGLLDISFSLSESVTLDAKMTAKSNYKAEASSPLGLHASLYCSAQASSTEHENSGDWNVETFIKMGPLFANTTSMHSYVINPHKLEGKGESTLKFDSSVIQGQNMIKGEYANGELSIISKTAAQNDALKHVAELRLKEAQLSLRSEANAMVLDKALRCKADFGISNEAVSLRIESQAEDSTNRAYSVLTGSLSASGLEVNLDGSVNSEESRGSHKGTLTLGANGLAASCSTMLQCSSMTFENIFNSGIDADGASLSIMSKGSAEDNRVELSVEGKVTSMEAYLNSVFKGNVFEADARNTMNLRLNKQGLSFNNAMSGSFNKMKTECTNTLTVTLWTLAFHSKTDNFICDGASYNHDIKVNMKPFIASISTNNQLELFDLKLGKEGQLKLEPLKIDLNGIISGSYAEDDHFKHSYGIKYADLEGSLKCDTTAKVLDSQISHKFELDFAGLSSIVNSEALVNSKALRLSSTVRTMALPFSLTVNAILNSDGELDLYGKHTGQLYSKYFLKAEPFAFAEAHDCRASMIHKLPNGQSAESHLENKFDGLLTPNQQSVIWKFKSKLNNHAYNQDINVYNNEEKTGIELAGVLSTNLFNKGAESSDISLDNQEFSLSGFLKYDKNSDSHIIDLPFIESLPEAFEHVKSAVVNVLESLQKYIESLNIGDLIANFRASLEELPGKVSDFMEKLDLENKINMVKDKIVSLAHDYAITFDDLELSVENLKTASEKTLIDISTKLRDLIVKIRDFFESGSWSDTISAILTKIGNELKAFDDTYEITGTIIRAIDAIEDVIRQIDFQKLQDSSVAWLRDLDAQYEIRAKLQEKVSEFKQVIETFDIMMLVEDLRDYIISLDLAQYLSQLSDQIPAEDIERVLDATKDVIVNWIDEYEIADKINNVYFKIRDLFERYEVDKKLEMLKDQIILLVKQYRIQETVQSIVDTVKSINFEYVLDRAMQLLDTVVNWLKAIDLEQSVADLNEYIAAAVKNLKAFDYNKFTDDINQKIDEMTNYINEQIVAYEIPQKIEASREFLREFQTSLFNYIEQLKNTRIAEVFKMVIDVINTTAYKDIKFKVRETLEDFRQRLSDMDIKSEIMLYFQRASESYSNLIAYISSQIDILIEKIREMVEDHKILNEISQTVQGVLDALKAAEIDTPAFTLPFTDLQVPAIQIRLDKLQDIEIPSVIAVPEFTVLDSFTIPSFTINFEGIKLEIVGFINMLLEIELPTLDLDATFGDLRVLYLSDLPDLTFSEIKLSEIKIPSINVPKLNLEGFEITMLPLPEVRLPQIPTEVQVPAFGKLSGGFRVNSPHYTLMTEASLENSTSIPNTPALKGTLISQAKSSLEFLEYSLDAMFHLESEQMTNLVLTETVKVTHMAFSIDHEGTLTLTGPSADAKSVTTAKATTDIYTADLVNTVGVVLKNGIAVTVDTDYNHNFNIPSADVSCQTTITQSAKGLFESGTISVTVGSVGSGKWSIKDYSDEGTYKSDLEFNINTGTAKLTYTEEANSKSLKMKKTVNAESIILGHITFTAYAETETPFIKSSVMALTGKAQLEDLKTELKFSHDTELIGGVSGVISNACEFLAQPFELILDCKNKLNSKILLPLKLTGKIDLQNDYDIILKPELQHASWVGLARFNQYKCNHNFTLDNDKKDISIYASLKGEANLDFLTVPLSIPEMTVPYFETKTPTVKELSLWDHFGLKDVLSTPRQSFDMDFKLQYQKNPDMHSIDFDLEPFYTAINENAKILSAYFEHGRDKVFDFLTNSYEEARIQYEKYKIDTSNQPPRTFTVPGYTVPILNIQVSSFRAELPAFSYVIPKEVSTPGFKVPMMGFTVPSYTLVLPSFGLPVIHVPETLRELTLPTFTLPDIQDNIKIPALGNMTYDFSFKSAVITVNANGGFYNQSDIVAKFRASSTSVFDFLKGKIDGTTSLSKKRGLKLATALSLEHMNSECSHDNTVSFTKRNMEASLGTNCKITLPILTLDLNQALTGNTNSKPNVASKIKLKYAFSLPVIEAMGKGNIDHNFALEALTSYVSLENTLKGNIDGTIKDNGKFTGALNKEGTIYLNANGLRATLKTDITSEAMHEANNIWNIGVNENFALEASLRRVYATLNYTCNNEANLLDFTTNGKHYTQATLEFAPLVMLSGNLNIDMSQESNLGHAGMVENIDLSIVSDKQKFFWSGKEQLASTIHSSDLMLSNDENEIRFEMTESWEGHVDFLKSIKLPIYQKNLWDVLKFDQATSVDELQFLNASTILVYTKNKEGISFALPTKVFENGITFNIPEITLKVPDMVNSIFEDVDLMDDISIPPVITIPDFNLPLTTLHVPSFTIDLKNLEIPNMITTTAFDITLPGLPKMEVPSFNIDTKYIKDKMSFLLVKLPQYEITISSFTLPKTFTIGENTINLDEITNKIYHFEMPTITIPEQKIDIPEISLYLPASVFIPSFGALSATVKLSSPIYNNTWTGKMENRDPNFVCSLKSSCTSTMTFLEYDLDATASFLLENGALLIDGKCTLSHSDFNINCKHNTRQDVRMKREAPSGSRHTLDVDFTSQTFADVSFRFASHNNGITASVSSPSSGFIGFLFTRRSPSQFYGKLFSRYLSTPDKDTDLLSFKTTLRNSEKLSFQFGWYLDGLSDMMNGLKDRMPAITSALLKFINKYHTAHFGMDLNRAALKLKNTVSNTIEKAYNEIPQTITSLQDSVEQLNQQGQEMLRKAADSLPSVNVKELSDRFSSSVKELLENYEKNARVLLDAVKKFLSETKFHLPGLEEKLTGQELYHKVKRTITKAVSRAAQRFTTLIESIADTIASFISGMNFNIPGTNTVINGKEILENLKSTMRSLQDQIIQKMKRWDRVKLDKLLQDLSDFLKFLIQKTEELISSLNMENLEEFSNQINSIYNEANNLPLLQGVNEQLEEARRTAAEYKDSAKMKVQEIYNSMTIERLNSDLIDLIGVLESNVYGAINSIVDWMKMASQSTQPYIRVTSKKMDVDIPLPFYWKSFSEWPSLA